MAFQRTQFSPAMFRSPESDPIGEILGAADYFRKLREAKLAEEKTRADMRLGEAQNKAYLEQVATQKAGQERADRAAKAEAFMDAKGIRDPEQRAMMLRAAGIDVAMEDVPGPAPAPQGPPPQGGSPMPDAMEFKPQLQAGTGRIPFTLANPQEAEEAQRMQLMQRAAPGPQAAPDDIDKALHGFGQGRDPSQPVRKRLRVNMDGQTLYMDPAAEAREAQERQDAMAAQLQKAFKDPRYADMARSLLSVPGNDSETVTKAILTQMNQDESREFNKEERRLDREGRTENARIMASAARARDQAGFGGVIGGITKEAAAKNLDKARNTVSAYQELDGFMGKLYDNIAQYGANTTDIGAIKARRQLQAHAELLFKSPKFADLGSSMTEGEKAVMKDAIGSVSLINVGDPLPALEQGRQLMRNKARLGMETVGLPADIAEAALDRSPSELSFHGLAPNAKADARKQDRVRDASRAGKKKTAGKGDNLDRALEMLK